MKNLFITLIGVFAFANVMAQQYEMVVFDYEKNYFNQGSELPAETFFILNGKSESNIEFVNIAIYNSGKKRNSLAYSTQWKRDFNNKNQGFEVPINYKLRGSSAYDFVIATYRRASENEKANLQKSINSSLQAYISGMLTVDKKSISFNRGVGAMMADMNDIVNEGTRLYVNKINFNFQGFSDIVKFKLEQLKDANLKKGKNIFGRKEAETKRDSRRLYAEKLMQELNVALEAEVKQFLNTDLLVLNDVKEVRDYPVEKTLNIISINAGYGGAYFDGNFEDFDYDHGPYIGLSFPLGKASFSSPFWSNTSISAGVFLTNFENQDGEEITGPVFQRPYYVGLGYKVFQFIRINAGATFLEVKKESFDFNVSDIKVRPFIGISAELNLWVGLGKR